MPRLHTSMRAAVTVMALLVVASGPSRTSAQLFPFTSLRHIFDNLKFRGGGNNVARLHSENDALPQPRPVAPTTHKPHSPPSTASAPTIFLVDPASQYRKFELERPRHFTPIQSSTIKPDEKSPKIAPAMPPVPSRYLQPPRKDLPLRVDLSEVAKFAGEKVKVRSADNSPASSQDVPKNHKISPLKTLTNDGLEADIPTIRKKARINTPRKLVEKHTQVPSAETSMDTRTTNHIARLSPVSAVPSPVSAVPIPVSAAPVVEPEESESHLDVPEGGEDRVEFQMHGLKGPKSYKFGYDTGKGQHRQFRYEERDEHGYVRGHYGYVDDDGKLQVVNYQADPHTGYHADVSKLHL